MNFGILGSWFCFLLSFLFWVLIDELSFTLTMEHVKIFSLHSSKLLFDIDEDLEKVSLISHWVVVVRPFSHSILLIFIFD